jgi:hypothetical protein
VARAREIADRIGDSKSFWRLLEQEGLEKIINKRSKSKVSDLLRIMKQLSEVTAWHEALTEEEQIAWAAPITIIKRCPVFNKSNPTSTRVERAPTRTEKMVAENERLKAYIAELEAARDAELKPSPEDYSGRSRMHCLPSTTRLCRRHRNPTARPRAGIACRRGAEIFRPAQAST